MSLPWLRRRMRQAREAEQGGLPAFPGHGRPRDEDLARMRKEVKALREASETSFPLRS
jgi:hypothetical protein